MDIHRDKMNRKRIYTLSPALFIIMILPAALIISCRGRHESAETKVVAKTPVKIGYPRYADISDTVDFPAITSYLRKNILKSSINGEIESVSAVYGKVVARGEQLFSIRTIEASAMKAAHQADTSLGINGLIRISSPIDGVISSVSHQAGDFVQQGDELAVVSDRGSLVFILEVPFEMNGYIGLDKNCPLLLPDNTRITGRIVSRLPEMNTQNQTVKYVITTADPSKLPENLIASALVPREARKHVLILPKAAVLGNETLTSFWVMKMMNDSVAIKVPVRKGIESGGFVEIQEPQFVLTDRILTSGNYALPDTTAVIVEQ